MRKIVRDVITKKEATSLMSLPKTKTSNFNNNIINKVIKKCISSKVDLFSPSYYTIEQTGGEHKWHVDTGSLGHMKWCNYGISVLLSSPGDGGIFKYKNPPESFTQKDHYLSAIVHTSDEKHKREKANDDRTVLLIFLKGSNE